MNKLLIIAAATVLGLLAYFSFFVFYPISSFPSPKGPYGVGQNSYHWIDSSRKELNAQDPQHPNREMMVHVYYPSSLRYDETGPSSLRYDATSPTEKNEAAASVAYDADAAKSAMEYLAMCSHTPEWLFSSIKNIKTHAQLGIPLAQSTTPFPVIIFSHGGGPIVQSYTRMLEELASHGFVVIGINHPYLAHTVRYPDGRVVTSIQQKMKKDPQWKLNQVETDALDASFVINKIEQLAANQDPFWSHVDPNKVGMCGHSFGGRTTFRATLMDKRIKCGINMDGGVDERDEKEPFSTPFMFMHPEKSFIRDKNHPFYIFKGKPVKEKTSDSWYEKLARTPGSSMNIVTLKDVGHAIFTDAAFQLNMTLFGRFLSRHVCFHLEVPAEKAVDIFTNTVMPQIINFFDEHLKNKATAHKKLIDEIKNFVNHYYKDFIPYEVTKNDVVIDKTEYVRNIATMYDIMQLQSHFYSDKKSTGGIDPQVLNKINENADYYVSIYKKNPSTMRQASAFLALLLSMISKVKYETDIKQITETLYAQIDDLEPQFELGEVLMALSILDPKKDILNNQIDKIIKNIEHNEPKLNNIFQYNWLSKFIVVYQNDHSRKLFTLLGEKIIPVLRLFTYEEEETNYLAVAYECLASLLVYDKSIAVGDLIDNLTEKLIKRHNPTYGLFAFKNGDMRLDITGHIINGFICMDKVTGK